MKKSCAYIVAVSIILSIFMVAPISAEDTASSQIERNFKYIVPMDNKSVDINYDAGLIIAMRSETDMGSPENPQWTTTETYAIFDFDGGIVVDYDMYDSIEFLRGSAYMIAKIEEDVFYLDKSGNRIALPEAREINETILLRENDEIYVPNVMNGITIEDTESITILLSSDGSIIHSFEKQKYRNANEYDRGDDAYMPLEFNYKGYAAYVDENGLCGVIDMYGNIIIEPEYQLVVLFGDYAAARKDDKWGIIGYENNIIIDLKYSSPPLSLGNDNFICQHSDDKSKIINLKDPDMFKDIEFDSLDFNDSASGVICIRKGQECALISDDGKILVPFLYNYIGSDVSDGLRCVGSITDNGEVAYGFVDMEWNLKIPMIYSEAGSFSMGFCGVVHSDYRAVIDKENRIIINLEDDMWFYQGFSEGLAVVRRGDPMFGKCEYIDKTGKTVIASGEWGNHVDNFKNGLAVVSNKITGYVSPGNTLLGKFGVIKYLGNTPSSWAAGEVEETEELGIIPEDMRCLYNNDITRRDFAYVAIKYLEAKNIKFDANYKENNFTDTNDLYINLAYSLEIVNGYEDGTFRPHHFITRQEAAAMLTRVYNMYGSRSDTDGLTYDDNDEIGEWALKSITLMKSLGVMKGDEANRFNPNSNYTREQSYLTFLRLFKINDNK